MVFFGTSSNVVVQHFFIDLTVRPDIDPKQKGFVSRHEVESLFRAWKIPIGPTSLCQIVDKLCPPCGISTTYPTCGLVDY